MGNTRFNVGDRVFIEGIIERISITRDGSLYCVSFRDDLGDCTELYFKEDAMHNSEESIE